MNQPPPIEKQTGKRIVSKGEYAKVLSRKLWLWVKVAGMSAAGVGLLLLIIKGMSQMSYTMGAPGLILLVGVGFACWYVGQTAREIHAMETVVPLTRANTADLPAPDSLVRASEEPRQEQEAVLLRAATETQERHEEQLVRASAGGAE